MAFQPLLSTFTVWSTGPTIAESPRRSGLELQIEHGVFGGRIFGNGRVEILTGAWGVGRGAAQLHAAIRFTRGCGRSITVGDRGIRRQRQRRKPSSPFITHHYTRNLHSRFRKPPLDHREAQHVGDIAPQRLGEVTGDKLSRHV